MRNHVLAIDQGTTSSRAIVFDARMNVLAIGQKEFPQHFPASGWVEHDPEDLWETTVWSVKEALKKAKLKADAIAAIGITNQRETTVIWDKATGKAIHNAIVWQDRRTAALCRKLKKKGLEPKFARKTGLLLDPYFSGTKIAWVLDHVPGARARAEAGELLVGTMDCWVIWKLTGGTSHVTDATNASRTLLFDLKAQAWSAEMLEMLNVPGALMPKVLDCADAFGVTEPELLGRAIPICGVAGDQQAALMGQGCIRAGEMKATYGTGCFLLVNTGEHLAPSRSRLLTTVAARLNGRTTYALEGSIFIAGAALQWVNEGLKVDGGGAGVEKLAQTAKEDHGVVLVPAFTGLGAPWWDANARGAIFGMTRDSGIAEIAHAAFDACALQTRDLIEAMRADAPGAFGRGVELRIDGGMSRSVWFSQRLADLTGVAVGRATYLEMTALGAALFAGIGAGLYANAEEAVAARPTTERFEPSPDSHNREAAYARWLDAVARVRTET